MSGLKPWPDVIKDLEALFRCLNITVFYFQILNPAEGKRLPSQTGWSEMTGTSVCINLRLPPKQKATTLSHELFHCLCRLRGLEYIAFSEELGAERAAQTLTLALRGELRQFTEYQMRLVRELNDFLKLRKSELATYQSLLATVPGNPVERAGYIENLNEVFGLYE